MFFRMKKARAAGNLRHLKEKEGSIGLGQFGE